MYAVIQTGGKQYRVQEGDVLKIEKLAGEAGSTVEFDKVLLMGEGEQVEIGAPFLDGRKVTGTVRSQGRGPKVEIIKLRRRKHYRRTQGHRQAYTEVEITGIGGGPGKKAAAASGAEASSAKTSGAGASGSQAGATGGAQKKSASSGSAKSGSAAKSGSSAKSGAKKTAASSKSASSGGTAPKTGKASSAGRSTKAGTSKGKSKDS